MLIDRCVLCLLSILCLWVNLIIVWNTVTIFSKQIKFVTIHENIYGSRAWLIFRSTKIHRHRSRTFWIYQHVGNRNKKFGMHQFGNNYTTTKGKKNGKIRFHKTHQPSVDFIDAFAENLASNRDGNGFHGKTRSHIRCYAGIKR